MEPEADVHRSVCDSNASSRNSPQQGNTGEGPFAAQQLFRRRPPSDFPIYTTIVPRLSFAYNVTGSGRVAFKGSYGRYIDSSSGPNSQPGPGASDVNPNASKNCTFNNWNGVIPFVPAPGERPNSVQQRQLGRRTRKIVANALTTRFGTLDLDGNYLDEYTAGLEVAFTPRLLHAVQRGPQIRFSRHHDQQSGATVIGVHGRCARLPTRVLMASSAPPTTQARRFMPGPFRQAFPPRGQTDNVISQRSGRRGEIAVHGVRSDFQQAVFQWLGSSGQLQHRHGSREQPRSARIRTQLMYKFDNRCGARRSR